MSNVEPPAIFSFNTTFTEQFTVYLSLNNGNVEGFSIGSVSGSVENGSAFPGWFYEANESGGEFEFLSPCAGQIDLRVSMQQPRVAQLAYKFVQLPDDESRNSVSSTELTIQGTFSIPFNEESRNGENRTTPAMEESSSSQSIPIIREPHEATKSELKPSAPPTDTGTSAKSPEIKAKRPKRVIVKLPTRRLERCTEDAQLDEASAKSDSSEE